MLLGVEKTINGSRDRVRGRANGGALGVGAVDRKLRVQISESDKILLIVIVEDRSDERDRGVEYKAARVGEEDGGASR